MSQPAGTTLRLLTYPGWRLTAKLVPGPAKGSVVVGSVTLRGPHAAVQVVMVGRTMTGEWHALDRRASTAACRC